MTRSATASESAALARVVDGLGSAEFATALLAWLAPTLGASHATAFRFDAGLQVRIVMTASVNGSDIALRSAQVYSGSGLYRHDRLLETLRKRGDAAQDRPAIIRLRRAEIADAAYGEQLWDRFSLVDRLSALALLGGHWTALNLYRDADRGLFGARELRRFATLAPLLLSLLHRHLAGLQPMAAASAPAHVPIEALAALLQQLPTRLSPREREVCALTLAGHTREGIGLALGIATSSVATLRERAYRKLQIHGAGELFALCLQHAAAGARPPG